jgi:DNA-binding MarR family transcriptional regulator
MSRHPPITPRQLQYLAFIAERIAGGLPPTNSEMRARFGVRSSNAVQDVLKSLERKSLIERDRQRARAIYLTPKGKREAAAASLYARSTGCEVAR